MWCGPPKLRLVLKGDITAAFASDLHDFVLQHAGRVPGNWKEFGDWTTNRHGKTRWWADVSGRMMELLPQPDNALADYPRYIRVIDPDIKPMESYINRMIFIAHAQLGMTNGPVNKASHATSEPVPGTVSSVNGG